MRKFFLQRTLPFLHIILVDQYHPAQVLSMLGVNCRKIYNTKQISLYHVAHVCPTSHHHTNSINLSRHSVVIWDTYLWVFTGWCFFISYSGLHDWATQCLTRDQRLPWNVGIEFHMNHFSIYPEILETPHLLPTKN